jgi:murein DD-endopeptidase MepM/ murein hydrolase activator NlpD
MGIWNRLQFTIHDSRFTFSTSCLLLLASCFFSGCASTKVSSLNQKFASFPSVSPKQRPILPTDNDHVLKGDLGRYVAQTGWNQDYGMPGWSRNGGTRFHEGVDITPISTVASKQKIKVSRKSPVTGRVSTHWESVRIPKDQVYSILDGEVVVASTNPARSGYGKYVMIEHQWANGAPFLTLYAHLSTVRVSRGQRVSQGSVIGVMGQTARDSTSRVYLRAHPHCHFEVGRLINPQSSSFGNKYDPRNMQPYNPIEFFERYNAIPRKQWAARKTGEGPFLATVGSR